MPVSGTPPANATDTSADAKRLTAEVISVGDEMTTGQRLDTNSQWLSRQLCELGIHVAFHTTVTDDLVQQTDVIRIAATRADIVVMTGGLGPTKDDLTRQAVADAAGVDLEFHEPVVEHIRFLFEKFGRKMPDTNLVQAHFPVGSTVIDNVEGTAPGIEFTFENVTPVSFTAQAAPPSAALSGSSQSSSSQSSSSQSSSGQAVSPPVRCTLFALPGVPPEMKQMWAGHVGPAIGKLAPRSFVIHHHVLRCFGFGESQAENMLPDMMRRDREPRVGITASNATISFRITARGDSHDDCIEKMQATISEIKETMGEVVFGENDDTLAGVVLNLLESKNATVAFVDFQFSGNAARLLQSPDVESASVVDSASVVAGLVAVNSDANRWIGRTDGVDGIEALKFAAEKVRNEFSASFGIAVSRLVPNKHDPETGTYHVAIVHPDEDAASAVVIRLIHAGHSAMRDIRSAKHVLNCLRLLLLR